MRTPTRILATLVVTLVVWSPNNASARPRPPWPPLPELAPVLFHESFDDPYWLGRTNAEISVADCGTLVESWSGYALERSGAVLPFLVPGLDAAGRTNLAAEGALRLWLKPGWSSAPAGTGPENNARVVERVILDGKEFTPVWWLQLDSGGNVVSLICQSATGPVTLLKAEIAWAAGQWHQVTLNYGAKGTALYLDGELAAAGPGVPTGPPVLTVLVWGSHWDGTEALEGEIEELHTFAGPLTVAWHYAALKAQAALGPITPEEEEALAEWMAQGKAEPAGEEEGGSQILRLVGGTSECVSNVPVYLTNIVCSLDTDTGWTVLFDIQGGTNGVLWDIFTTTNLIGSHITNSQ